MSIEFLAAEIRTVFKEEVKKNGPVDRSVMINSLLKRKKIKDVQAELAAAFINDRVRQVLNRLSEEGDTPDKAGKKSSFQLSIPGFESERIQPGYWITRKKEPSFIPVMNLTAEETRAVAEHHRKMGEGCQLHAEELDRLADWKEEHPKDAQ